MRAEEMQKILMNDKKGFITAGKSLIASLGLNEAILYTELVSKLNYYQENDMAVDEFYCTYDDLYISTGILKTAQQTALKNLENFGLIKINLKGMPRKRYIRILDAKEKIIEYLEEGQKKIDELIKQSKEKSSILKEKIAESLNNKQLAEISEQESRNLLTSNQKSANKFAGISEQESRNLLTSSQESALNNNRIIILDNNNKEIIKENNNNNNISYNRENVNNNTKEENNFINSLLVAKEENNDNSSLVTKEENNDNIPLVLDSHYEDEITYSGVDNNIKDILQYFVNKYFDYYGCKYSEKETFYTDDIKKYAKLIYSFSSDFGIEATIDGWKKKVDVFFTLEYDKTLDIFLQFDVINHILNSIYYEEYEEYENNDLPF